jgi:tetratricopeptide (TPR) repeat protein
MSWQYLFTLLVYREEGMFMMKRIKSVIIVSVMCFGFLSGSVQAASDDIQSYIDRGEAYSKEGQSDKAMAEFNKALELDPKNANAINDRGLEFWFKGDIDSALADYNKAIEINPSLAVSYNNRGLLYGKGKGEFDLAIADLTKAIEIDPKFIDAYLSRGMAYSFKQEFDKSIADYSKVIEINPNVSDAYFNRAAAYFYKGEYAEAWKDVHYLQSIRGKVPAEFIKDLNSRMPEPQYSVPSREKGLVVHFGPKAVVEGISGRFMYSVGVNGEKKSVDLPADLIGVFLQQDKTVQENGIWVVVTNPDAYSAEEKEMINTLEDLCKQKNIIFFKARGMDLPGGWKRIN